MREIAVNVEDVVTYWTCPDCYGRMGPMSLNEIAAIGAPMCEQCETQEMTLDGRASVLNFDERDGHVRLSKKVEPTDVSDLIWGTGVLGFPWWAGARVIDEDGEDVPSDGPIPPDAHFVFESWNGDDEGGKLITILEYRDIVHAAQKVSTLIPENQWTEMVNEGLCYADSMAADAVLQTAVFGEMVYG